MVKKISGSTPTRPTGGTGGIKETGTVQSAQIDSVGQVGKVQGQARTGRVRPQTRPMTTKEREHLMQLVDEEAHKLFGDGKIPASKKESLTRGVKLTLAAGLVVDDEEEKS